MNYSLDEVFVAEYRRASDAENRTDVMDTARRVTRHDVYARKLAAALCDGRMRSSPRDSCEVLIYCPTAYKIMALVRRSTGPCEIVALKRPRYYLRCRPFGIRGSAANRYTGVDLLGGVQWYMSRYPPYAFRFTTDQGTKPRTHYLDPKGKWRPKPDMGALVPWIKPIPDSVRNFLCGATWSYYVFPDSVPRFLQEPLLHTFTTSMGGKGRNYSTDRILAEEERIQSSALVTRPCKYYMVNNCVQIKPIGYDEAMATRQVRTRVHRVNHPAGDSPIRYGEAMATRWLPRLHLVNHPADNPYPGYGEAMATKWHSIRVHRGAAHRHLTGEQFDASSAMASRFDPWEPPPGPPYAIDDDMPDLEEQ